MALKMGPGPIFVRKELSSICGQNFRKLRKWGLAPFCTEMGMLIGCNFSCVFNVYINETENNDKGDIDEIKNEIDDFFDGCFSYFCRI
jgi:hypothetical protein